MEVQSLMGDLEKFINDPNLLDVDPLIKMAIIHHRFETIHPFYDGNGRTGRIINVLYLVKEGLLEIPILYMSRYIVNHKSEYYRLLQTVRTDGDWEEWVNFMLLAVEQTSQDTIKSIELIREALQSAKHEIRNRYKFYSQDLINSLFKQPYTKVDFLVNDLGVTRFTARKYLDDLTAGGFLVRRTTGRANYYINWALYEIITGEKVAASNSLR